MISELNFIQKVKKTYPEIIKERRVPFSFDPLKAVLFFLLFCFVSTFITSLISVFFSEHSLIVSFVVTVLLFLKFVHFIYLKECKKNQPLFRILSLLDIKVEAKWPFLLSFKVKNYEFKMGKIYRKRGVLFPIHLFWGLAERAAFFSITSTNSLTTDRTDNYIKIFSDFFYTFTGQEIFLTCRDKYDDNQEEKIPALENLRVNQTKKSIEFSFQTDHMKDKMTFTETICKMASSTRRYGRNLIPHYTYYTNRDLHTIYKDIQSLMKLLP